MHDKSHPTFIPPSNEDSKIWRYIDLQKFWSMLNHNSLFFSKVTTFDDPYEGSLPEYNELMGDSIYSEVKNRFQSEQQYENFLKFGLEFAKLNRLEMARQVSLALEKILGKKIKFIIWTNKNHNHALKESGLFVHRKGATPAKRGERGIIPANMRDGSFLVIGKGNKEFISSSSHGAGRALSRTEAKKNLDVDSFKKQMIEAGVIGNFTYDSLDEAPEAYKDIYKVLDMQKESIKIINHLKPFINWQGERFRDRR